MRRSQGGPGLISVLFGRASARRQPYEPQSAKPRDCSVARPASPTLADLSFGSPACTLRASSGPAGVARSQASSLQPQASRAPSASSARPRASSRQPHVCRPQSASPLALLLPDVPSFLNSSSHCLERRRPRSVPCTPSPREDSEEERRRRCRSENDEVLKKLNLTMMHSLHATGDQVPGRDASSDRWPSVPVRMCPLQLFILYSEFYGNPKGVRLRLPTKPLGPMGMRLLGTSTHCLVLFTVLFFLL